VQATNRLAARVVITPGSVFVLETPPTELRQALVAGVGEGRECGLGAVLPHPGIAQTVASVGTPDLPCLRSRNEAGRIGVEFWRRAHETAGPSPSQIAAVIQRALQDPGTACEYLERQSKRPEHIWDRWGPVLSDVQNALRGKPECTVDALRVWHDLAVVHWERDS